MTTKQLDNFENFILMKNSDLFFKQFFLSVLCLLIFYSLLYYYLNATLSAGTTILGIVLFSPINLFLSYLNYQKASKVFFVFSCNFYVFGTSLGMPPEVNTEIFFIPSILVGLLLFGVDAYRKKILFSSILPIISWTVLKIIQWKGIVPAELIYRGDFIAFGGIVNFASAASLTLFFLSCFVDSNIDSRNYLIQNAKLSTLGEVASGIAHEINNPLTIIITKLSLLKKKVLNQEITANQASQEIDRIVEVSNRIVDIVKRVKMFSRDSSLNERSETSLEEIFTSINWLVEDKLKNAEVHFHIEPIPHTLLLANKVQLEQVFINLIFNSADAIEKKSDKWIKITFIQSKNFIKIYVIDSGDGIPPEIQSQLLRPFFSTKKAGQGTGLGLVICNQLIEEHNGKFRYFQDSKNTTFEITLPTLG